MARKEDWVDEEAMAHRNLYEQLDNLTSKTDKRIGTKKLGAVMRGENY